MLQTINKTANTISRIIDSANEEVIISSGKLIGQCYDSNKIIQSVKKARKKNVRFYVIVGPQIEGPKADAKSKSFVSLLESDIYVAPSNPVFHFAVADSKNLRFETIDIDSEGKSENITHWGDFASGGYLRNKFFASLPKAMPYTSWLKRK